MKCKLCGCKFTPAKGQLDAYWAVTWCEGDNGKLCPPCHKAASELEAVSDESLPLGILPFGSDILKRSKNVTRKDWERRRQSESWRTWVEENHPEWL
jgi:hypothetical protein